MRRLVLVLILFGITIALPVGAATPAAAPEASSPKDPCAFDPQNIVLNDAVKLYFCVPIADALCERHCGAGATSAALSTTITNGRLGKTSLDCAAPGAEKETAQDIGINGLADPLHMLCKPSSSSQAPAKK